MWMCDNYLLICESVFANSLTYYMLLLVILFRQFFVIDNLWRNQLPILRCNLTPTFDCVLLCVTVKKIKLQNVCHSDRNAKFVFVYTATIFKDLSEHPEKIGQHLRSKASAALELSKVRQTVQRHTKRCVLTLRHVKRRYVVLSRQLGR